MGPAAGGGVVSVPAWVKEQRADGALDALDALTEILARFPDASVHVSSVYQDRDRQAKPWWRVTVQVGPSSVFVPRFEAFDDATSFRVRAVELASAR